MSYLPGLVSQANPVAGYYGGGYGNQLGYANSIGYGNPGYANPIVNTAAVPITTSSFIPTAAAVPQPQITTTVISASPQTTVLYRQLATVDPSNITQDRFPEIRKRLSDIETVQRTAFSQCSSREEYMLELERLLANYRSNPQTFDHSRLASLFRCIIFYSAVSIPTNTVPTLTARISNLISDLQYQKTVDSYLFYHVVSAGLQVARIKTTNSRSFTDKDNQLINETWIALLYLNSLKNERDPSPYFKYVYGAYTCGMLTLTHPIWLNPAAAVVASFTLSKRTF
jgi:hypothetical protein